MERFLDMGRKIVLVGSASSESVSPYWCFERTAESSEANLVRVYHKIHLVGGPDPITETPQSIAEGSLAARTGAVAKAAPSDAPASLKRIVQVLASGVSHALWPSAGCTCLCSSTSWRSRLRPS